MDKAGESAARRGETGAGAGARASTDAGTSTAEFAVLVPAVIAVIAMCIAALQIAGTQIRLQDAAAVAARSIARGDDVPVAAGSLGGVAVASGSRGPLVCARLSVAASGPAGELFGLTLNAESCALAEVSP